MRQFLGQGFSRGYFADGEAEIIIWFVEDRLGQNIEKKVDLDVYTPFKQDTECYHL
jgi:hypothetical protein